MSEHLSDRIVYLDYAATTPVAREVVNAMHQCLTDPGRFANPSSLHLAGRGAAAAELAARSQLAALLNVAPRDLIWTSGATEADNLAIIGGARFRAHRGKHLITMRTEHKAVVDAFRALEKEGFQVSWLTPQADGLLVLDDLRGALRDDTQLVSIMHVNNETGVIQDIAAIGRLCREHDILFHCDAAQSVGKLALDLQELPIDLLSLTAHKFHGPPGVGALFISPRDGCGVQPLLHGGGQQRRLRPGTLPTHLLVGCAVAAELAVQRRAKMLDTVRDHCKRLWSGLQQLPGVQRNGSAESHYPGILNVSAAGVEGESLRLALEPLCVASGSACNSQSGEPSYVLRALGCSDELAQSAVRFSFGRDTSVRDIEFARDTYISAVRHLRGMLPGAD